jgi:long-subunit acyl-CoA synthetase (AMP-forming)
LRDTTVNVKDSTASIKDASSSIKDAAQNIKRPPPTIFPARPRIWIKTMKKVDDTVSQASSAAGNVNDITSA